MSRSRPIKAEDINHCYLIFLKAIILSLDNVHIIILIDILIKRRKVIPEEETVSEKVGEDSGGRAYGPNF